MRRSLSITVFLFALLAPGWYVPLPASAQGQIYTDTMDSAATGLLSVESQDPSVTFTYQNGQYLVTASDPSFEAEITSYVLVPDMASSRLTVDAAVGGNPDGKYAMVGCRAAGENDGYAFVVFPGSGTFSLYREDAGESVFLTETIDPTLIGSGNATFQIGIDCSINIITGIVNGEPVLNFFDPTYEFGTSYLGAGASGDQTDGLTVGFDNLSITDKGTLVLGDVPPTVDPNAVMPIPDPNVDPTGALSAAFAVSQQQPPAMAGGGGDATVSFGQHAESSADVKLASFYTETYFLAPNVPAGTVYQVGFSFWIDPLGNSYLIWIEDDGTGTAHWGYAYNPVSGGEQVLQSGVMPPGSIDPTPGAMNFVGLMVYEGVAILSGNTYSAAVAIPLQGSPVAGNLISVLYYFPLGDLNAAPSLAMSTSDFAVWDLSSGLAPSTAPA